MKKAMELSILCDCDVTLTVKGDDEKIYQFCSGESKEEFKKLNRESISCKKPSEFKTNQDILDFLHDQEEKDKRRKSSVKRRKSKKPSVRKKIRKSRKKEMGFKVERGEKDIRDKSIRISPSDDGGMRGNIGVYRNYPHPGANYSFRGQQPQRVLRSNSSVVIPVGNYPQPVYSYGHVGSSQQTSRPMQQQIPKLKTSEELEHEKREENRLSPMSLERSPHSKSTPLTLPSLSNILTNQKVPSPNGQKYEFEDSSGYGKKFKKLQEKEINIKNTVSQFQQRKSGYEGLSISLRPNTHNHEPNSQFDVSKTGFTPSFSHGVSGFSPDGIGYSPIGSVISPACGYSPNAFPLSPRFSGLLTPSTPNIYQNISPKGIE